MLLNRNAIFKLKSWHKKRWTCFNWRSTQTITRTVKANRAHIKAKNKLDMQSKLKSNQQDVWTRQWRPFLTVYGLFVCNKKAYSYVFLQFHWSRYGLGLGYWSGARLSRACERGVQGGKSYPGPGQGGPERIQVFALSFGIAPQHRN